MNKKVKDINLKLRAPQNVRIRSGVPEANTNNLKGYLHKGFTVDLVEEWEGEKHTEGGVTSHKWYRDNNGDFYWEGGFKENNPVNTFDESKTINYSDLIQCFKGFETIFTNKGFGINVAVIDSGIYIDHPELKSTVLKSKNYTKNTSEKDVFGHGTHISGIIAGTGPTVTGIAPESKIISHKVIPKKDGIVVSRAIKNSLTDILNDDSIKVINMSFNMEVKDYEEVNDLTKKLTEKGKILVASGNEFDYQLKNGAFVPAYCEDVISVGVFSENLLESTILDIHSSFDYLIPKISYFSTYNKDPYFKSFSGSSMNTAIVTGLIALYLSSNPDATLSNVKDVLNNCATSFANLKSYSSELKLYRK